MNPAANTAGLVLCVGIVSTAQTHLAQALERQGIETWDLIRASLRRSDSPTTSPSAEQHPVPNLLVYTIGLVLNHTTFLYHLLIAPLAVTIALSSSMYGMGLIAHLLYATRVTKEGSTRLHPAGTAVCEGGGLEREGSR